MWFSRLGILYIYICIYPVLNSLLPICNALQGTVVAGRVSPKAVTNDKLGKGSMYLRHISLKLKGWVVEVSSGYKDMIIMWVTYFNISCSIASVLNDMFWDIEYSQMYYMAIILPLLLFVLGGLCSRHASILLDYRVQ